MTTMFSSSHHFPHTAFFFQHRHRDAAQLPLRHQGVATLPQRGFPPRNASSEQPSGAAPALSTQSLEGGVEADGIACGILRGRNRSLDVLDDVCA